jgi:hypothetical protein
MENAGAWIPVARFQFNRYRVGFRYLQFYKTLPGILMLVFLEPHFGK